MAILVPEATLNAGDAPTATHPRKTDNATHNARVKLRVCEDNEATTI